MPGIHFIYDPKGSLGSEQSRIEESMAALVHFDWYTSATVVAENECFLGYTHHDTYPVTVFDEGETLVCIEGSMYGRTVSEGCEEIQALIRSVFSGGSNYREQIAAWQLETDGDFIVFALERNTGRICIFNDGLGRLPLYYRRDGGRIFVSREIGFITHLIGEARFDRRGIAEYMLFGYPLGDRTLFDNIHRLPPASFIRIDARTSDIEVERAFRYNLEEKDEGKSNAKEQAEILIEKYCEACRNRYNPDHQNVLTLSGGLDSRVVAAALERVGATFSNATFVDYFKYFDPDVDLARQIADALGLEWKLFTMGPPKGRDVLKLLRIKSGLNFFGMGFSIPLFEAMRAFYGDRITLFTGDGGDRLLPDLRPMARLRTIDDAVDYIIEHYTFVPLEIVSGITGIHEEEMLSDFREQLAGFEEKAAKLKFVNFMILERNFKWLFEGEDRNRYYSWPVAPFYAIDFFTHALSCPDSIKENHRFYREVLVQLSPEVAAINNAKWHFPITSGKLDGYYRKRKLFYSLPPGLRKAIKTRYKKKIDPYEPDSNIVNCFREQLETCTAISEYLSIEEIQKCLYKINKYDLDHIFTVTSAIEEFGGETSTLERYSNVELI